MEAEGRRQRDHVELIASENFVSGAVLEVQGSLLTNKYAEGYPGRRWYGGCEHVDTVEQLAIDRAKELFGAEHVNVQPHSGSQANAAVYFAFLQPGDRILTMDLAHGGHLTHGHKANFSGKFYEVTHYGVSEKDEQIDYEQLARVAAEIQPKLITCGASAYSRVVDYEKMGAIAKETGAFLFVDMAHIAGLVAAGVHPTPVPHADFVTTTTHKSLRGPRGGLILCREEYAKKINSMVFPGVQGGPLMHVIAAKAVCFGEALRPGFKDYQGAGRGKCPGAGCPSWRAWFPDCFRRHGQSQHACGHAASGAGWHGSGCGVGCGRNHGEQERNSLRYGVAHEAEWNPAGDPGGDDPGNAGSRSRVGGRLHVRSDSEQGGRRKAGRDPGARFRVQSGLPLARVGRPKRECGRAA